MSYLVLPLRCSDKKKIQSPDTTAGCCTFWCERWHSRAISATVPPPRAPRIRSTHCLREEDRKGGAENPASVLRYAWIFRWCSSPLGFPGDTNGKEPACQSRRRKRCRINPWVRKIPWRRACNPLQCSCLEKESHGQEPGWLQSLRSQREAT